jgi:hypothetical protein
MAAVEAVADWEIEMGVKGCECHGCVCTWSSAGPLRTEGPVRAAWRSSQTAQHRGSVRASSRNVVAASLLPIVSFTVHSLSLHPSRLRCAALRHAERNGSRNEPQPPQPVAATGRGGGREEEQSSSSRSRSTQQQAMSVNGACSVRWGGYRWSE